MLGELVLVLVNVDNEENEEELDDELENVGNEENEAETDGELEDELDAEGVDVIIFKLQQNIISVSY